MNLLSEAEEEEEEGRVRVNEGREERSQLHVKSLRPKQKNTIVEQENAHFGQFWADKMTSREDISLWDYAHPWKSWMSKNRLSEFLTVRLKYR